jgi:hypothetical protein
LRHQPTPHCQPFTRSLNKLDFLESNPDVTSYQFFTDFTIPKQKDIERRKERMELQSLAEFKRRLDGTAASI